LQERNQSADAIVKLPKYFKKWQREPRRRSTDKLKTFSTQIGIGIRFQGSLHGAGSYLIQGEVIGDGDIEGTVVLAAGANWKGDLTADYVRIAGRVEGDVVARSKIELISTAVVTGNLSAPLIAIEEGSTYQGTINRPRKTQVTRYTERRGKGGPKPPS
jgi:cytoskeletal protein CcmA (bactofilin family)